MSKYIFVLGPSVLQNLQLIGGESIWSKTDLSATREEGLAGCTLSETVWQSLRELDCCGGLPGAGNCHTCPGPRSHFPAAATL